MHIFSRQIHRFKSCVFCSIALHVCKIISGPSLLLNNWDVTLTLLLLLAYFWGNSILCLGCLKVFFWILNKHFERKRSLNGLVLLFCSPLEIPILCYAILNKRTSVFYDLVRDLICLLADISWCFFLKLLFTSLRLYAWSVRLRNLCLFLVIVDFGLWRCSFSLRFACICNFRDLHRWLKDFLILRIIVCCFRLPVKRSLGDGFFLLYVMNDLLKNILRKWFLMSSWQVRKCSA